jgi:hypothetical protein
MAKGLVPSQAGETSHLKPFMSTDLRFIISICVGMWAGWMIGKIMYWHKEYGKLEPIEWGMAALVVIVFVVAQAMIALTP